MGKIRRDIKWYEMQRGARQSGAKDKKAREFYNTSRLAKLICALQELQDLNFYLKRTNATLKLCSRLWNSRDASIRV